MVEGQRSELAARGRISRLTQKGRGMRRVRAAYRQSGILEAEGETFLFDMAGEWKGTEVMGRGRKTMAEIAAEGGRVRVPLPSANEEPREKKDEALAETGTRVPARRPKQQGLFWREGFCASRDAEELGTARGGTLERWRGPTKR